MEIKKGIAVSPGVAIADAVVLDAEDYRIPYKSIESDQVEAEQERVERAFDTSLEELGMLRDQMAEKFGQDTGAIFDFHMSVLKHGRLRQQILDAVAQKGHSAAYAVSVVMQSYQKRWRSMKDQFFAERYRDVQDIENRLLRNILGEQREDLARLTEPVVLVAHDLSPSLTANLNQTEVCGVAMDFGGLTSHTAIVVRSLGIPAVMGLKDISISIAGGNSIIVDGTKGLVIIDPDKATLREYQAEEARLKVFADVLVELRDKPAVTKDHVTIQLLGNIEFPPEAKTCIEKGATGIGLYRTEFLYLKSETEPQEEEHYRAYREVVEAIGDRPVTIRTLDLGADKYTQSRQVEPERNPFLGLRSIRYCLQNLPLFKTQLRAILRVSKGADVQVMFPLIMSLMELRQAKMALGDAMEDLEEEGIPFQRDIRVGIMVETPAAALQIKELTREVDFISIGTNDLIQYTLAVDRSNERVAPLFTASHPSVLKLLRDIIRTATRANVGCSLCGEMAGEPVYTLLLLGMGLRSFSMAPADVPEIKKLIRSTTLAHAERVAKRALTFDTDRQVANYLRDETRKLMPEAF
ncbi:MAG: phosphoenolpyruvate--protein phosphotransferase [Phycisphaerae bacterium]|nr:phosphoenolpyruvate--protein phosphotransferase [Phycisphaerae bacterium]